MRKRIEFSSYHTFSLLLFYSIVIVFSMLSFHPYYVISSFMAALIFAITVKGKSAILFFLLICVPIILFFTIFNLLFVHSGATVFLFINGNPITIEAGIFGLISALIFVSVMLWLFPFNDIVGGDKIIAAIARALPQIALIISMVLRLIPTLKRRAVEIVNAQTLIGCGVKGKCLFGKIRFGIRVLSILITISLENGLKTCNSMRARGYGNVGRLAYQKKRFRFKDTLLCMILLTSVVLCCFDFVKNGSFIFYPIMQSLSLNGLSLFAYISFLFVCFMPCFITFAFSLRFSLLTKGINSLNGGNQWQLLK